MSTNGFDFDEIVEKLKVFADVAGKKTNEVVEVSKLKLEALQVNADISKGYEKLGMLAYEANRTKTENLEIIQEGIDEVDRLLKKLSEINVKIDNMKNVAKCPVCQTNNPEGSVYCAKCGDKIVQTPDDPIIVEPEIIEDPTADKE